MTDYETIKEEIRARLPIADLVSRYVVLKQSGSNFTGLCPFHNEKTPSFNVSAEKEIFKCFGCGKGGDIFTFIMEKENFTFPEAMKFLADMVGIQIEPKGKLSPLDRKKNEYYDLYKRLAISFNNILLNKKEAKPSLDYLESRDITTETAQEYLLGYLPDRRDWLWNFLREKNYSEEFLAESGLFSKKSNKYSLFTGRLVFPIFDRVGRVVAFSGRRMNDFGPKYINSPETIIFHKSNTLFGIQKANAEIRRSEAVYIVEGNFDVISMHQSGVLNCIAPLGTAFTQSHAALLKKSVKKAYCLFDGDKAGLKAAGKATLTLLQEGINSFIIELPENSDPSDILKKYGAEALQKISKYSINSFDYLLNKAVLEFGIDNIENKEIVVQQMMPYINLISTEVRKSDALRTLAEVVGIDFVSLQKDFSGQSFKPTNRVKTTKNAKKTELPSGEMLLLISASLKIEYYKRVRRDFSMNDMSSKESRELFISMEDCYRHDQFDAESILANLDSEAIRDRVAFWFDDLSFIQDPERTLADSSRYVRLGLLNRKKIEIQGILNSKKYRSSVDNKEITDYIEEVQYLTNEINRIQGEV